MAIDNNKLYSLKGSQLKDLSTKVKAKADQADTYTKTEVDNLIPDVSGFATTQALTDGLATKADKSTTYTKTEVDALIPDITPLATKAEVTSGLALKADVATTYTKTDVDTALSAKADTATTYTKTEVDGLMDTKEDAGVVFDASTDYSYATMSNALGKGLVYVTTNGTNRRLVTHTNVVDNERDITLYVENSSGTYTGQLAYRWIDGEAQPVEREYVLPTGGTTGQILAKRSNVTGDVQWANAGGAKVQVNSTGEFGQTMDGDNLMSFSDNGTNVDMQMAKGSTANNLTLATKDYVDGRTGINFAVGQETWYGTYTDENNVVYQVYTKTIYIPALPAAAGVTTYPHDVSGIKQILQIYGFCSNGFVMNAPRQTITDNITIYQASKSETNKNLSIEVGRDRSNLSAYVVMVYAKDN